MSEEPLRDSAVPSVPKPGPSVPKPGPIGPGTGLERALMVLDEAGSLDGAARAEAFERFHDALAAALGEEPGG
ncbi:hypothetical protein [Sinomonas susongensis]|uniref:hypothetical protein n=1 Tax=Sinomonas susongensis TaxID=1324851 RepID=UPI0011089DF7|nr:hypothetical protein [Sinomonas susongensis]